MAHIAGLVAAGVHPSPVPHSHFVTTTTHKTLRGPRGGLVLCQQAHAQGPGPRAVSRRAGRAAGPRRRGQGRLPEGSGHTGVCGVSAPDAWPNAARLAQVLASGGFRIVSGGTDNHLMLVDVFTKGLTGKVAEATLGKAAITVNKNAIPFDQNPPMVASRRPHRHARDHDARHGRERDGRSGRLDRPCPGRARQRQRAFGGSRARSRRCARDSPCTKGSDPRARDEGVRPHASLRPAARLGERG